MLIATKDILYPLACWPWTTQGYVNRILDFDEYQLLVAWFVRTFVIKQQKWDAEGQALRFPGNYQASVHNRVFSPELYFDRFDNFVLKV